MFDKEKVSRKDAKVLRSEGLLWKKVEEFKTLLQPDGCDANCIRDIFSWILKVEEKPSRSLLKTCSPPGSSLRFVSYELSYFGQNTCVRETRTRAK